MAYRPDDLITVKNTVTHVGAGDTLINVFQLTGIVRVHELYGVVTEATEATVFQKVGLVLYDATPTTVEITDITAGVDCSGTVVGSFLTRTGVVGAASALTYDKADTCGIVEQTYEGGGYTLYLIQKSTAETFIKVEFTGAAATDVNIQWFAKYTPMSSGSSLVAV